MSKKEITNGKLSNYIPNSEAQKVSEIVVSEGSFQCMGANIDKNVQTTSVRDETALEVDDIPEAKCIELKSLPSTQQSFGNQYTEVHTGNILRETSNTNDLCCDMGQFVEPYGSMVSDKSDAVNNEILGKSQCSYVTKRIGNNDNSQNCEKPEKNETYITVVGNINDSKISYRNSLSLETENTDDAIVEKQVLKDLEEACLNGRALSSTFTAVSNKFDCSSTDPLPHSIIDLCTVRELKRVYTKNEVICNEKVSDEVHCLLTKEDPIINEKILSNDIIQTSNVKSDVNLERHDKADTNCLKNGKNTKERRKKKEKSVFQTIPKASKADAVSGMRMEYKAGTQSVFEVQGLKAYYSDIKASDKMPDYSGGQSIFELQKASESHADFRACDHCTIDKDIQSISRIQRVTSAIADFNSNNKGPTGRNNSKFFANHKSETESKCIMENLSSNVEDMNRREKAFCEFTSIDKSVFENTPVESNAFARWNAKCSKIVSKAAATVFENIPKEASANVSWRNASTLDFSSKSVYENDPQPCKAHASFCKVLSSESDYDSDSSNEQEEELTCG